MNVDIETCNGNCFCNCHNKNWKDFIGVGVKKETGEVVFLKPTDLQGRQMVDIWWDDAD